MQTQRTRQTQLQRSGYSLLELVVTIVMIGIVVSLTLPALQRSRQSSKKLSCLNNMRNLGLAIVNYSSTDNSQLPLLVDTDRIWSTHGNAHNANRSWCIAILPYLDQVGFRERWDLTARVAAGPDSTVQSAAEKKLSQLKATRIPIFTCYDDDTAADPGALSYCANIGYVTSNFNTASDTSHYANSADGGFDADPSVDTDVPMKFASGVFWRPHTSRMSLDFISAADGMTQTLMLSENLQAGEWHATTTGEIGFGVDMAGILNGASLKLPANYDLRTATTDSRIGSQLRAEKGTAWRPSSNHPSGAVNVIYCDGSGRSLVPSMDPGVYARLFTPAGLRYGQDAVDGTSF
ncbi:DUF1559 family PulG-like putative transporter [Gimesia maris]|uniref:DUF1559 domain-containing protein n=1 Tax=Gimesia maris TaxID=122 RepID=A0ABX5YV14_9PLAN|nr:DUF1559 domain-containing protein [Gimesia maris]QEG19440.1 hypothetical protein GmarT_53400 [Gimesia maris]QGQ27711.1 DUF1559 domain-containing protein [Gimesia maris]